MLASSSQIVSGKKTFKPGFAEASLIGPFLACPGKGLRFRDMHAELRQPNARYLFFPPSWATPSTMSSPGGWESKALPPSSTPFAPTE